MIFWNFLHFPGRGASRSVPIKIPNYFLQSFKEMIEYYYHSVSRENAGTHAIATDSSFHVQKQ
jgi:hypothetical protein